MKAAVWKIPLTSWLASAGVLGIAVGFAAKDTLSNLFSGIFIVADTPYKVGDFVVLDNQIRGQIMEIGMRRPFSRGASRASVTSARRRRSRA